MIQGFVLLPLHGATDRMRRESTATVERVIVSKFNEGSMQEAIGWHVRACGRSSAVPMYTRIYILQVRFTGGARREVEYQSEDAIIGVMKSFIPYRK